jgi:two-component system alkaline phosphatase synthesis response regulator PhoP
MKPITIGNLSIDPERFNVINNGVSVILTKTEFYLLYLMMSTKGKIHSREQISMYVWGEKIIAFPRTIDVHISNVRKKIGKINNADVIISRKGVGYKLNDAVLSSDAS